MFGVYENVITAKMLCCAIYNIITNMFFFVQDCCPIYSLEFLDD